MDEKYSIEIPFGAKDSELKGWEYIIPEGMEAEIKDGKIIVREKESEDERIRKGLINYFNDFNLPTFGGLDPKKILAWIEKQGSQNLANSEKTCKVEPKFKVGDTIHEIGERHIFPMVIEKIEDGDYVCDNGSLFINIEFQDKYELVEQNPAWSEADENRLKVVISFVNSNPAEDPFYDKGCLKDWLKSLKDRYTWKPSDEQMEALIKKACDFFEENIEEEDCKIGSSEWTELRAEYKSLDSFIRAFRNYMKGE